jgi:methylenetetrahydrofolate reductase (NADPH)
MKIRELFGRERPVFSFEFFPPKNEEATKSLFATVEELKQLAPSFVSVTYGAGGSTRDRTIELVGRIKSELGLESMAHLTCVGSTREEIRGVLDRLRDAGIENVLPLRGDPPQGATSFQRTEGGFGFASELVAFIRGAGYGFCLGGACYPEGHLEAKDRDLDLENLHRKVTAGVDFLITQLFFDNIDYFDFVRRARARGIGLPIVAGIMPITNFAQIRRFTAMCGSRIPAQLLRRLEGVQHDPEAVARVGVEHATAQCRGLLEGGAPGIHFYTLNKSPATRRIFENLTALRLV